MSRAESPGLLLDIGVLALPTSASGADYGLSASCEHVLVDVADVRLGHPVAPGEEPLADGILIDVLDHVQWFADCLVFGQSAPDIVLHDANPVLDDLRLLREVAPVAWLAVAGHDRFDIQCADLVERVEPLPGVRFLDEALAMVEYVVAGEDHAGPREIRRSLRRRMARVVQQLDLVLTWLQTQTLFES